jgi:hypothetical protein
MRDAFIAMIASYVVFAFGLLIWYWRDVHLVLFACTILAASGTALFALHVLVFGIRFALFRMKPKTGSAVFHKNDADVSRRSIIVKFVKAAGMGLIVGAVTSIAPRVALAGEFECGTGGRRTYCVDGQECCQDNRTGFFYCCGEGTQCGGNGYCR